MFTPAPDNITRESDEKIASGRGGSQKDVLQMAESRAVFFRIRDQRDRIKPVSGSVQAVLGEIKGSRLVKLI